MENNAELLVKNLCLGFEGDILVENLNFQVNSGDYLCIIGENGAGKTTLMRTILKLISPVSGTVEYAEGTNSTDIGYLPQQTNVQRDFPASVWEIVLSGCQNTGRFFYSAAQKQTAEKNIRRMGIEDLKYRSYRELSGGQQQRVLLARALCAAKKILLLDEPVAGLDPKVTAEMYELIQRLNREGITIIMISHDVEATLTYASHILHLGEQIFYGTKEEYLCSKH